MLFEAQIKINDRFEVWFNPKTKARHYAKDGDTHTLCGLVLGWHDWEEAHKKFATCRVCKEKARKT